VKGPDVAAPERPPSFLGTTLLSTLGLLPSLVIALVSLGQPWASARVVAVWGVSKSWSAQVLLVAAVLALLFVAGAIATRGRRLLSVAAAHLALGGGMITVSLLAFEEIKRAGVSALGIIPIASVRSGPGVKLFFAAGAFAILLGALELVLGVRRAPETHVIRRVAARRRTSRRSPPPGSRTLAGS
jgi:hypothetical protein